MDTLLEAIENMIKTMKEKNMPSNNIILTPRLETCHIIDLQRRLHNTPKYEYILDDYEFRLEEGEDRMMAEPGEFVSVPATIIHFTRKW